MKKIFLAGIVSCLVFICLLFLSKEEKPWIYNSMKMKYVITETVAPDSFDPKDADKTQNLTVMRMLYATPLEINSNNIIESSVLDDFHFDEEKKTIHFKVKTGLEYSDGTPLQAEDVKLAIARMAYLRPEFPVIKYIKGVKLWADAKLGLRSLPAGIRIIENDIWIEFDRKITNPLFRFCLELFSIIPQRCINLDTAEVTCDLPPSSGFFIIDSSSKKEINFRQRAGLNRAIGNHKFEISFQYRTLSEVCNEKLDDDQIISISELDFLQSKCAKVSESVKTHWMPSSRFSVLRFNPNVEIFGSRESRQYFAEMVRKVLKRDYRELDVQRGLFPKLLPGYINSEEIKINPIDQKSAFVGKKLKLIKNENANNMVFAAIIKAAEELKMNVELVENLSPAQMVDLFVAGECPVVPGASGFWAQDPVGDVSMWFTRNLHKTMTFLWSDQKIYQQISDLENESSPELIKIKMQELNRYLVEQSVIAPVLHYKRGFMTSSRSRGLNLPQAITSPAPWQLMGDHETSN